MIKIMLKELEIIFKNTALYVTQIKDQIISMITNKLENYQDELMAEIRREITLFKKITDIQGIQESYDSFKESIRVKLSKLKNLEGELDNLKLNAKMSSINRVLLISQQQEPDDVLEGYGEKELDLEMDVETFDANIGKLKKVKLTDYFCPICQQKQIYSYAARVHLRCFHGIEKGLSCPHCDLQANRSDHLADHIFTKHFQFDGINTYQCMFSGKQFRTRQELQTQIASHAGYLPSIRNK